MLPRLLDTDTLSEIMKARNMQVIQKATRYLDNHDQFTFSIITRYEILRGLKAKQATKQISHFQAQCNESRILFLSDKIIDQASNIYGELHRQGRLIGDADILIAATAIVLISSW